MSDDPIFHLAISSDWNDCNGDYRISTVGKSLDEVGFVHCSTASQVQQTADLFYRGREDVTLLEIDPRNLTAPLKYEQASDGQSYPHVYGPITFECVVSATPLKVGQDGRMKIG